MEDNFNTLEKIAKELLEKETIEKDRFEEIVGIHKEKSVDGTTKTEKVKEEKKDEDKIEKKEEKDGGIEPL